MTNFKNIGDFLCNVLSLSLSLSQHRCVACDGMEVCASLTRAEPPGTDGSHRANWRERLSAQVSGASFQVHHHQIFARQVYRVCLISAEFLTPSPRSNDIQHDVMCHEM